MKHRIKDMLTDIESRYKIKILYACETGSRAWGFPSPDSDYDVRFLYMHKRDWYLSLGHHKDSIEHMDGDFDVTGWDLRKSLLLLKKSNTPLIERFQSPIVYFDEAGFSQAFKTLIEAHYSPTAVFFHHYSLAGKFWDDLKDKNEIKLKSFFYLVRSLLSCNWIIQNSSVLPMNIFGLMDTIDDAARSKLEELIKLKAGVNEKYLHPKSLWMHNWVESMWFKLKSSGKKIGVSKTSFADLDAFFLKMINGNVNDR
ncbi:nucleotidyltransferase domain-containing protein [Foetidibacter luteolus]|uniref:nucleotidyltransferase domain-containing protein n=1 Tax=Foetidibacter luteolus TaxID=2608880 RepID=UPI00129A0C0D|nr:nucleotidyltransferase domain-containing protein [Foetidibacter luteolus]